MQLGKCTHYCSFVVEVRFGRLNYRYYVIEIVSCLLRSKVWVTIYYFGSGLMSESELVVNKGILKKRVSGICNMAFLHALLRSIYCAMQSDGASRDNGGEHAHNICLHYCVFP